VTDATPFLSLQSPRRPDPMLARLTGPQMARMEKHGHLRDVAHGEVIVEPGKIGQPMFVVVSGTLEIIQTSDRGETLIGEYGPGMFTGESTMLSGRPGLALIRVAEPGRVIEVPRESLLVIAQTDSELSEIILRAFILRRGGLIDHHLGDVMVLGSTHSAATLRIREFLTRNGHPHTYVDLDFDTAAQEMLDRFQVTADDVPVVIKRGAPVLRSPSNEEVADLLSFNEAIDRTQVRDLVVIGAGPAGLAAAVYGASEGLDVLVVEQNAPGGQAGSSSRIENYLGFPTGVTGLELAARAYTQAQKFGAQVLIARGAHRLACERTPYGIEFADGSIVAARSVIIATGAEYRRLSIENVDKFDGAGIYYAATFTESQLCREDEVIIVGGANSAGQAAVFLAQSAKRVHVLVRGPSLSATMSRYLIRRIEETPEIEVHTGTEIVNLYGDDHLERVTWRDKATGKEEQREIRHIFSMTGALPCTAWLNNCVAMDEKGFIKTGPDLTIGDTGVVKRWPLARPPFLLETSLPGVFAVGDVRSGSMKRVASAVGEGSIAISFVHRVFNA
jgi:thioredoxin reductase (NADPH)